MPTYRLLAGQFIQPDLTQPAHPLTGKRPSKSYSQGARIVSRYDLVKKHGAGKFQLLSDKPAVEEIREVALHGPVVSTSAPGGQVSSGFQSCTSTAEGRTISGPDELLQGEMEDSAEESREMRGRRAAGAGGLGDSGSPLDAARARNVQRETARQQAQLRDPAATEGQLLDNDSLAQQDDLSGEDIPARRQAGVPQEVSGEEGPQTKEQYHAMLDRMTVAELRSHAADERIDLGHVTRKEDIVRVLKSRE